MHADDVEEGLAVDVEAGAGAALRGRRDAVSGVAEASGGHFSAMRGGLQISLAAHDGGEGGGEVAAGVGVVGQSEGHEQRAEVGVAQAERAVVVRVLARWIRWDSRSCRPGYPSP